VHPTYRALAIPTTLVVLLLAFVPSRVAAEESARRGHGRVSLAYHYGRGDGFQSEVFGRLTGATTDSHALDFAVEYNLTNRWTVTAGIPLVMKRAKGDTVGHNPQLLGTPQDTRFIDDGKYHTNFQDFRFGMSYLATTTPIRVEPFIEAGLPSNDYPFFGGAAVGQNLWRVAAGSRFSYRPPLSDFYFSLTAAYVFVEETLGVNVNHVRFGAEIGHLFNRHLGARVFALGKQGKGLLLDPENFGDPFPPFSEEWYHHDQTLKHNYINAGGAIDWFVSPRVQITFMGHTGVHHDEMTVVAYAVSVGISRSF